VSKPPYVDPRIIDRYHAGVTIAAALDDLPAAGPDDEAVQADRQMTTAFRVFADD
jgi:hypothetical protein